jgi:hypothetical protein
VCVGGVPVQLVGEARQPPPARPGTPARHDYEYTRNGTANPFMTFQPPTGWRHVAVTDRRAAADFAELPRWLVEDIHAGADRVVLVTDNLNTHAPGCLYEAFDPARARATARKLEWHYTPKHGSWLNVAEVEPAALSKQRLGRRLGTTAELERPVGAREEGRNGRFVEAKWRFATADPRIKLRRLYPSMQG